MSLTTIKKISLDFYNNNIVMINEKQLDVGSRYVNITCTENGKKFFVNPETMSAHIRYKKADGKDVFNDVEILEDGTLCVELTQQMLAVEGKHLADIILVSANGFSISDLIDLENVNEMGGSIISTMSFYINVLPAVVNSSDITSTDEFGFLEGALVKLASVNNELTNLMGDKTDDASKDTLYGVKAAAEDAVEYVENSKSKLADAINEANAAKDRADKAASNASEKASYAYEETENAKKATKAALDAKAALEHTLDGVTVSSDEINRLAGVKFNIQEQLNNKSNSNHEHSRLYVTDEGQVELTDVDGIYYLRPASYTADDGTGMISPVSLGSKINNYRTLFVDRIIISEDPAVSGGITVGSGGITVEKGGVTVKGGNIVLPCNTSLKSYSSKNGNNPSLIFLDNEDNIHVGNYTVDSSSSNGDTCINTQNGAIRLRSQNNQISFRPYSTDNYSSIFSPSQNNDVALGSDNYRWYKLFASAACSTTSDEREKSDITAISDYPIMYSNNVEGNVFEQLFYKLNPKTYTLNVEKRKDLHIGFVAQDIEKSLEELGLSSEDLSFIEHAYWKDEETDEDVDRYSLAYEEFIALNTHMIQKQKATIDSQQLQINTLEERIKLLEEKLQDK